MAFKIYHKDTTYLLATKSYATERAAKTALTKMAKKDESINKDDYAIADACEFHTKIEKTKIVKNLVSQIEVEIPVNTPRSCDPSSNLYHSM